ncbi:MAG: ABC transporter permease [Clostridiales bacterium]|nr:ABC transporter permease [Clostridiales bacterium]
MNVRNNKVIRRLSRRSLMASKKQNIITIFAIILTSVLFTSLFTVYFSLDKTIKLQDLKTVGYSCHAMISNLEDEKIEGIKTDSRVKETGEFLTIGNMEIVRNQQIAYLDDTAAKFSFSYPVEGSMPKEKNEIVLSKNALDALKIEKKIGADVKLDVEFTDAAGEKVVLDDTFKLSGWSDNSASYICVSEEYARDYLTEVSNGNPLALRKGIMLTLDSDKNVAPYCTMLMEDHDVEDRYVFVNPVYDKSADTIGEEGIVSIVVFILLIFVTGFLIIYNIFQITVAGKIRNYGLLKTVGVTAKQLRKMILGEAFMLCIVGIPVGLFVGYLIGNNLMPVIMSNTTYGNSIEIVSGFNILVFLGAALFSVATVYLSCLIPVRKASKVSPVEALRFTDTKVSGRPHSGNRASIPMMALSNLGRNKKRTAMVLLSLSLALVIFNSVCALLGNIDMNSYVQSSAPSMDFTISSPEYFVGSVGNGLTDAELENINSHIDSSVSGKAYLPANELVTFTGSNEKTAVVVGIDDSLIDQIKVTDGDLNDLNETSVVLTSDSGYKVGDTISLSYMTRYGLKEKTTGEIVFLDTDPIPEDVSNYEPYSEENTVEYEVCALTKQVPSSFSAKFSFTGDCYNMIMSKDGISNLTNDDLVNQCLCINASSDEAAEAAEKYLSELTKEDSHIEYSSIETVRQEYRRLEDTITKIGFTLAIVIGLIGILNFINAVMTSILSRKHELALLRAVGMTSKQLKRMLFTEGFYYSILTIITAVPFCLIMNILIGNIALFWLSDTLKIVLWPILLILPIFALLSYVIPNLVYGSVKGNSIIDDLRVTE